MGPRPGSPAAETPRARAVLHRRASLRWRGVALFIFSFLLWPVSSSLAASVETSHTVTVVVVPTSLSMSDDAENFRLEFDDPMAGSDSSTRQVHYRVSGNAFSTGALPGIVSAEAECPTEEIELKAEVGSFVNDGTEGNILLHASAAGEQVVGSVPVPLAGKEQTSGEQAAMLNGTVPVEWKARSTRELSLDEYIVTLTVTLRDA